MQCPVQWFLSFDSGVGSSSTISRDLRDAAMSNVMFSEERSQLKTKVFVFVKRHY